MTAIVSKGVIFKLIKKYLRTASSDPATGRNGRYQYSSMAANVLEGLVAASLLEPPVGGEYHNYVSQLADKKSRLLCLLNDCYMQLFFRGILIPPAYAPGPFEHASGWAFFEITDYGIEWANADQDPPPEDIDGFMEFIKKIPEIDDIVLQYMSESLRTLEGGHVFASAVMLGAAAEKVVYLLGEAIIKSCLNDKEAKKIQTLMDHRKLHDLHEEIMGALRDLAKKNGPMPYPVHEESINSLNSLLSAMRIQRNNAVHPVTCEVDRPELYLLLLSFPHVCKRAYNILIWLKDHRI